MPKDDPAKEGWLQKSDQAAGWLLLMTEQDQRVHFAGIRDSPVKMWKKLHDIHNVKKPGSRFDAYDDLFSIRKKDDETLQSLVNRVEGAMANIKNLRPDAFTIDLYGHD